MERPEFDTQFERSILAGLSVDCQGAKIEQCEQPDHAQPAASLSIEANPSLALLARNSIQNGLPIPQGMLSHSLDLQRGSAQGSVGGEGGGEEGESAEQLYFNHKIKVEAAEEDKEWFVEQLGLNELLYLKKFPSNTKNVLRNFGNAQNQYALYHREAKLYVHEQLASPERFYAWIRGMKLEKFDDFKAVWNDETNRAFKRVYRQLCYRFYRECAIPYVLISRMKSTETKLSHLRYIYRFLQGLKEPEDFNYFKKAER